VTRVSTSVRKVSKWEFDGLTYDTKEEARAAERRAVVEHLLEQAGFDWRVAEPIAKRWEEVERVLQEARKTRLAPKRADG
jgi:hypothetical protein